jgi:8-oxo-dGTP pyrophosphatase MutT (NUDIX family)
MTTSPPSVAHPSASILLLRDGDAGLEVLMITRHAEIVFAGGAMVFPGGRLDAEDRLAAVHGRCRGGGDLESEELALRVTGIRESYEEAHILLARRWGEEVLIAARDLTALEDELAAELGRVPEFRDLVESGRIELATDLLIPFAHWITPANRAKRFDTYFYVAPAPADQVASYDGHEAVDALWVTPAGIVAEADAERVSLIFVTRVNLVKLGRARDAASALAAARVEPIVTVCPEIYQTPQGPRIRIPSNVGYDDKNLDMPAGGFIARI